VPMNLSLPERLDSWPWPVVGFLLILSLAASAIALWKAARRGQLGWFVFFFFVHTAGILEAIYIFAVAKGRDTGGSAIAKGTSSG
jgi:hypothetical protein